MFRPDKDPRGESPMRLLWAPLWVACLLCALILFFLVGRELRFHKETENAWSQASRVPLLTLEGIIKGGASTNKTPVDQLIRAERMFLEQCGEDTPDGAASLNRMAIFHALQGDYATAESEYRQVIAILKKHLDPDDPDVVLVQQNLRTLEALKTNKVAQSTIAGTNTQPSIRAPIQAPAQP